VQDYDEYNDDLRAAVASLPPEWRSQPMHLRQFIKSWARKRPTYFLQPIDSKATAALLGKTPEALRTARNRGLAPPGFVKIPGLGDYYQSRLSVLLWVADQLAADPKAERRFGYELWAIARILPAEWRAYRDNPEAFVRDWADKQPEILKAPVSNAVMARLLGKTPGALGEARRRGNGPRGFDDKTGTYPGIRYALQWVARQFEDAALGAPVAA